MSSAGTPGMRGCATEILSITPISAAHIDVLRLPASTGSEPCSSEFSPRNLSSNSEDKDEKLFNENSDHQLPEKVLPSSTPGKRKRAEASKAPKRQDSNVVKPRQPQKARYSKSSKNEELVQPQLKKKLASVAPQDSRDIISSLSQVATQEQDEIGQNTKFDETCTRYSNIRGSLLRETAVSDQSADVFIPKECFEATSLTAATETYGQQKYPRIEAESEPQQGLSNHFQQVNPHQEGQESQSCSTFLDYSLGDLLNLGNNDTTSFNDDYPFDTLMNDFPWSKDASPHWGEDDEYPMIRDDFVSIMQLAEIEEVMTAAEGASIVEEFDDGQVPPSLSTESACMIEPNADHPWEVDDLFIESLQADWNDSEPEDILTGNRSFALSSPPPAQRSSACSQGLDSLGGICSESLYDDEDLDRELLKLGSSALSQLDGPLSSTPPSSPVPVSSPETLPPKKPIPQPGMPHIISFDADGNPLPFVRQPFAKPVRDRPVIHALRSQSVLRTCFRIGEALNAACAALSSDMDSVIELYARVSSSTREPETYKQQFRFADLFTADKPPFLIGVYMLWRGVDLWDRGSKVFLGEAGKGRMARVVGRMRKEEGNWVMNILCIWQVDWEEVGLAKGIVCS